MTRSLRRPADRPRNEACGRFPRDSPAIRIEMGYRLFFAHVSNHGLKILGSRNTQRAIAVSNGDGHCLSHGVLAMAGNGDHCCRTQ